ncbi:MAG: hypothetical protein WAT53_00065 [Nitrosomonas sp.]
MFAPAVDALAHTAGTALAHIICCGIQAAMSAESLRWSIRLFLTRWRTSRSCS